jgi:hypothetical protein
MPSANWKTPGFIWCGCLQTTKYIIYRSVSGNPGAGFRSFTTQNYNDFIDDTVVPGTTYEYVVEGISGTNSLGGGSSKLITARSCP